MSISIHHAIVHIGRALNPRSVERLGISRNKVLIEAEALQALYDDWRRLDAKLRALHAEEQIARQRKEEEND